MIKLPLVPTDPQSRHDYVLKTFVLNSKSFKRGRHKRDIDVIKENHKFIRDEVDVPESWETHLAQKYYKKLFKEYCIADLSCYKKSKIALRWRTEHEVVSGYGQFQCGSSGCVQKETLRSWEVNFRYVEDGIKRNALVKLRLCVEHSRQLNYTAKKRELKRNISKEVEELSTKRCRSKTKIKHSIETNNCVININKTDNPIQEYAEQPGAQFDVWNRKQDMEVGVCSRVTDFEKYLEDLLL